MTKVAYWWEVSDKHGLNWISLNFWYFLFEKTRFVQNFGKRLLAESCQSTASSFFDEQIWLSCLHIHTKFQIDSIYSYVCIIDLSVFGRAILAGTPRTIFEPKCVVSTKTHLSYKSEQIWWRSAQYFPRLEVSRTRKKKTEENNKIFALQNLNYKEDYLITANNAFGPQQWILL